MIIGYARVSTLDQDLGRQVAALRTAGCEEVYEEKVSGIGKKRPELDRLLARLMKGDVVMVQKLDRLGRSLGHLISIMDGFKRNGVTFRSLGDSIDTSTSVGNMMFQMLGMVAEFEGNLIRERTKDALAYKKSIGVRLGRPVVTLDPKQAVFNELRSQGLKEKGIREKMGLTRYKYFALKKKLTV